MALLLPIFIVVSLAEIVVFVQIEILVGLWPTVGIMFATGLIGTLVLRTQETRTFAEVTARIGQGGNPFGKLFEGFFLLGAAVLLMTPGFLTDAAGFALLAPPVRRALGRWFLIRMAGREERRAKGAFSAGTDAHPQRPGRDATRDGAARPVIDADYEDLPPDPPEKPRSGVVPPRER